MFTGIITDIGTIQSVEILSEGKRFRIQSRYPSKSIDIGASIAHCGLCMTVVAKSGDEGEQWYDVEAWEEALRLTTADDWAVGTRINLERSLKVGDELGGHLVSGHIDGTAKISGVKAEGDATRFTIDAPDHLARFIAPKGSVCLNGASLTVNVVNGNQFDVLLIRHSQEVTTWGDIAIGDVVNIEIDTMARYVARLAEFPSSAQN